MLQSMGSQRNGHDLATEPQQKLNKKNVRFVIGKTGMACISN